MHALLEGDSIAVITAINNPSLCANWSFCTYILWRTLASS